MGPICKKNLQNSDAKIRRYLRKGWNLITKNRLKVFWGKEIMVNYSYTDICEDLIIGSKKIWEGEKQLSESESDTTL